MVAQSWPSLPTAGRLPPKLTGCCAPTCSSRAGAPLHTLLVTSASPSEGKSLTAANLAVALAQAGRPVILVDVDLHYPRVHRFLGLRNNVGVSTALLQERHSLGELLQPGPVPGLLRVLTSGPLPPNAAELLGSARMHDLITLLRGEADMVVFDGPPVGAVSDAAIVSTQTDGVLLVVDAGRTRSDAARRAVEALTRVNARVVGVLLNRMPKGRAGDYYYSGYNYDYHSDDRRNAGSSEGTGSNWRRKLRKGRHEPSASLSPNAPTEQF
jgi:non-specific protein-tyrosine kinase